MRFRDPGELERAAASFNNLPLLKRHVPVNVDDPRPELVIGSTGTNAAWESPYLKNSIVIWDGSAIDAIENGKQKELSAAYRYDYFPETGTYQGQRYDGRMRNIRGSHLALVRTGRAGADCVVADEMFGSYKFGGAL